jgi:hypothetical protein
MFVEHNGPEYPGKQVHLKLLIPSEQTPWSEQLSTAPTHSLMFVSQCSPSNPAKQLHLQLPVLPVGLPPFRHIWPFLPAVHVPAVSQVVPEKPVTQLQVNWFTPSTQVP